MEEDEVAFTADEIVARETLNDISVAVAMRSCCTYNLGCAKLRELGLDEGHTQPIYSCLTCLESEGHPVGICSACSLRCHVDHEVAEVGDRRTFRCDCPTTRFGVPCSAQPAAPASSSSLTSHTSVAAASSSSSYSSSSSSTGTAAFTVETLYPSNLGNKYGHNFENRFCTCDKVYDPSQGDMFQCLAYSFYTFPSYEERGVWREGASRASPLRAAPHNNHNHIVYSL